MKKAIVVALGSAGDVHPNVGLALALRGRGFEVLFVGPEVFRPLARRTGLEFIGLGSEEEYNSAIRDPDLWHPTRSFPFVARRLILPALRPVYEIIEQHFEPGRTVVTAPALAFGARVAQEKLGIPLATIHLQPLLLRSTIQPGCFGFPDLLGHLPRPLRKLYCRIADRLLVDPPLVGPVNSFRAELGLPSVTRLFNGWIHSPELVIGLFPDWFATPQPDWPPNVSLTGFPLWDEREVRSTSVELEDFLEAGAPPVVFTAGSAMLQAKQFFEVSAEVCEATGVRGLLLTSFPEQLPSRLPALLRHFDYIPFSAVLPRTAGIVHHGGIGTTAQAIAAGIPQLVVPNSHDQPDNAVRIRRLGLGDYLLPGAYSKVRVIEKLRSCLMDSAIRENCRRAANLFGDQNAGLARASALVEQLCDVSMVSRSSCSASPS